SVEGAVSGGEVKVTGRIYSRCGTRHPDSALARAGVWSGIENRELVLHIGSAISYNPAVIRTVVSMRCPAHVNYAFEQSQARPLVFNKDIKRNISTRRPVSGSRRASADLDWSAELLITGHEIDRMQALVENRSRALRLTYHVEGVGAAVD